MNSIEGLANFTEDTRNNAIVDNAVFTESAINGPQGVVSFATLQDNAVNEGTLDVAVFNNTATNAAGGVVVTEATFSDSAACIGVVEGNAIFRDTSTLEGEVQGNVVLLGDVTVVATAVIQGAAIVADTVTVAPEAQFNGTVTPHKAPTMLLSPSATYVYLMTGYNDTFYTNASGTGIESFEYTWYKDGDLLQNATTSSLQVTAIGLYKAIIINSYGEYIESNTVAVSGFGGRTTITLQPENITTIAYAQISASSVGTGTVNKQWYRDGIIIQSAQQDVLEIEEFQGVYNYVASTIYETVTSNNASVTLTGPFSTYSYKFNNDYVSINNTSLVDPNLSEGHTIEMWFKMDSALLGQHLLFHQSAGNNTWSLTNGHQHILFISNNIVAFQYNRGGNNNFQTLLSEAITTNKWYHVAVTYDGVKVRLYLDGKLQSSSNDKYGLVTSRTQAEFGKDANIFTPSYLTGTISNFRYISGQALYTDTVFTVPNDRLTNTGYGDIDQNITGNVTLNIFQASALESGLTVTGNVERKLRTQLSPKDRAATANFTGVGNGEQGETDRTYTQGIETHNRYKVPFNSNFISVSSVNLLNNTHKVYTNFYSNSAVAQNTFVYSGSSALVTNLSGEITPVLSASYTSRYFENGNSESLVSRYYLPSADLAFGTADFTIEFWANQTTKPDPFNRSFICTSPTGTLILNFGHAVWNTNKYSFEFWKGGGTYTNIDYYNSTTNEDLVYNKWRHYAVCKQGTNVRLFIDGILKPEATIVVDNRSFTMTTGWFGDMYGYATNLRIIRGQALYTSDFSVPNAEFTNTGYGNTNQSITGTVTRYLQSAAVESGCTNLRSVSSTESTFFNYKTYGVNLNGNSQYISTTYPTISTDSFTLEIFVKINKLEDNQNIIERPILIGHYTNGKIGVFNRYTDYNNFVNTAMYTSNNVVIPGKWMHLAFVRNGNTSTFYVDGSAAATSNNVNWANNFTATDSLIGKYYDIGSRPYALNGTVSNFRLIKGQALYTTNFTVPSATLTTTGYGNVNQNITGNVISLGLNTDINKTDTSKFSFYCPNPELVSLF